LLLILVRRPYEIGDRINVSSVNIDTSGAGSAGWVVKDVDLFTTTVVYGSTNEVATYSNGSLASYRIINAARSPQAVITFLFKFPIDAKYERIQVFKNAIEQFTLARPREWAAFFAFRATDVAADLGYVQYIFVGQHRESWQNIGALMASKADLSSFALELMKKMNMRYVAPPMPIDLNIKQQSTGAIGLSTIPQGLATHDGLPPQGGLAAQEGGGWLHMSTNPFPTRQRGATMDDGSVNVDEVAALFDH